MIHSGSVTTPAMAMPAASNVLACISVGFMRIATVYIDHAVKPAKIKKSPGTKSTAARFSG